jgi:hypothetical protein
MVAADATAAGIDVFIAIDHATAPSGMGQHPSKAVVVFFERPHESGRGNRRVPWLTLTGDFSQCCESLGRVILDTAQYLFGHSL